REAELSPDPVAQADFLASLGEIRLRATDDAEGALAAFRDALERNPGHRGARDALAELLSRSDTREGALEILEPMAESRGDYEELVALYDYRLSLHDDRTERAHWLRRIAEVCDTQLGSPERAIEALGRALKEEPFPGAALDDIERIATTGKIPSDAAELIEAVLPSAEPEAARELALRAARLYEMTPADRGAAERLYTRVLESDPENVDALTALETFHRASGDSVRLAGILERRAGIELDPSARRRMLMEAARLHEKVGTPAAAIGALQALRTAEEGDAEVLGELARLYERNQDLPALCDVLTERARFSEDPSERALLYARIGQIKLGPLNDLDGAAEAYREAIEGAPENADVLSALEQIEAKREDWTALQEVLTRRLGVSSGADQLAVLQKLARNAEEKLSDTDQAVGYLHQILGEDPANTLAHRELERILRAAERWYDLVDVLTKHADVEAAAGRAPAALALRVAIADVWEQHLDSPDSAAEALEKVLEVAPTNVPALLSLARLHEGAERWDEAGEALERAAAAATSGRDAAEIHYRNAQILRAKEAPAADVEALLLRALDNDQTHRPTLAALEKVARDAKEPDRLVQLLQLQLEVSEDDAERKKLLAEIAALYKGPIRHPAQAVTYLELLTSLAPDEIGPREDLADALVAAGRADEAATLMRQLIDQLTKARRGKDVARYHQRLGAIAEAKGDVAAAADSFGAAYKLDPGQPATLMALGRIALQRNDLEGARKFYRALLLQNFDEASSGVSKAEVYLVLGRLHAQAKEISKARNMFERGLEIDPKNAELKQALSTLPAS
ncbi:MAG TPA: tetratricopeptide repeat protein, partial [Polyangia bacterium]|nr:tetratricopeptide repeat protein [Polyangia bacterium]